MSHETTLQRWHVETVDADWPVGLPKEEREPLTAFVKSALTSPRFDERGGTLGDIERAVTYALEKAPTAAPKFLRAAMWDFRYACIERALRACNAEQRWHAKELP